MVLNSRQASVTDIAHGTVQGSVIDFWPARHVESMSDSIQSFVEPVQLVQVRASPTVSSMFLSNMGTVNPLI